MFKLSVFQLFESADEELTNGILEKNAKSAQLFFLKSMALALFAILKVLVKIEANQASNILERTRLNREIEEIKVLVAPVGYNKAEEAEKYGKDLSKEENLTVFYAKSVGEFESVSLRVDVIVFFGEDEHTPGLIDLLKWIPSRTPVFYIFTGQKKKPNITGVTVFRQKVFSIASLAEKIARVVN